jgi:NADH:ubiquinone reductase (H+-translocating)
VIDRHNYHLFQRLLYQVATAALSPADIAEPLRVVLRHQQNATTFAGTYNVTADCIATAVVKDDLGEVLHEEGVVLGDGVEVRFIGTDPGAVIARVARRLQ